MAETTIRKLMIPIAEYGSVQESGTLYDAILALEETQKKSDGMLYAHRAVLVLNEEGKVTGKVNKWDVFHALEPKYQDIFNSEKVTRFGVDDSYIKPLMEQYGLLQKPLDHLCKKASSLKVAEIMHKPGNGEFVDIDATINEAVHQLVLGHHPSLLVAENDEIVGILRMSDVFQEVCDLVKKCAV